MSEGDLRSGQWILSEVEGEIDGSGAIDARTLWSEPQDTPRPRGEEQIAKLIGPDRDSIHRVNKRTPGKFRTKVRWGRGIAWVVSLFDLDWIDHDILLKVIDKYGEWDNFAFCGPWRDYGAPQTFGCADTCNDVATYCDPRLVCALAGLEIGAYRKGDGWARYVLPGDMSQYQRLLDERQTHWWSLLEPGLPQKYEAAVEFLQRGRDTLDGQRVNLTGEEQSGSLEDVRVARLALPTDGFMLRDIEHSTGKPEKGEPALVPLNRKLVLVVSTDFDGPMMFELQPGEMFTPHSRVSVLKGPNWEHDTNQKVKSVLTDAFDWA